MAAAAISSLPPDISRNYRECVITRFRKGQWNDHERKRGGKSGTRRKAGPRHRRHSGNRGGDRPPPAGRRRRGDHDRQVGDGPGTGGGGLRAGGRADARRDRGARHGRAGAARRGRHPGPQRGRRAAPQGRPGHPRRGVAGHAEPEPPRVGPAELASGAGHAGTALGGDRAHLLGRGRAPGAPVPALPGGEGGAGQLQRRTGRDAGPLRCPGQHRQSRPDLHPRRGGDPGALGEPGRRTGRERHRTAGARRPARRHRPRGAVPRVRPGGLGDRGRPRRGRREHPRG
ncbi:hypothetical protein SVIOM342S_00707 [Streptomyces violaceorubidus]